MKEAYSINNSFILKDSIYEITSISVENDFDIEGSILKGEFIISGDYYLHEISINKEDFSFKIPFKHEINSSVNLDTINLEITDFNYILNDDELEVNIDYIIEAEKNSLEIGDNIDELLNRDFDEDDVIEESKNEIPIMEEHYDNIEHLDIVNSINKEEDYVLYHVHTVTSQDTLESIISKYNISINELKKYNDFENLELNMKLLIPNTDEI